MRSTFRLFLATILLTAAAGVVLAQEPSAPPPTPAPEVAQPVAPELPQVPAAEPIAPVVEPAVTAEPIAPAIVPVVVAPVEPPVVEKPRVVTTTKAVTKKAVKKPAEKPVEKPAIQVSESAKPAAAAVGATAVDTTGSVPPPNAAASTAPPESIAPPPPSAKSVTVETHSEQAVPRKKLSIGSWILFGLAFLAIAGIAAKFLRRRLRSPTSIVDFTSIHPEARPAPVTRP